MDEDFWRSLPLEFEPTAYRALNSDLAHMTDAELLDHYQNYGRKEGRTANSLRDRNDFATLIPKHASVLEIGPFFNPLLRGPNVRYFDVLPREKLVARATSIGFDATGVPDIDYVGDLFSVDRLFDVVISSHCLEHQPDLINHLRAVGNLLQAGGAYLLLIPDKRYCLDHFIPLSNLAEIVVAHHQRRTVHTLRSVIEHAALTTHNDSLRHWQGDHAVMYENFTERFQAALRQFDEAAGKYVDVHAWYFTPESAVTIFDTLESTGSSQLQVLRCYPTRYGSNEFWMVLKARPSLPDDFNSDRYLELNRDVAEAGVDPVAHWKKYGHREGRKWK
jgi:SAM-dependent methyltransferase